jgi:environmental stress-induced protein Ves
MHILRSDAYRQVPWRNGNGQTAEIMSFPAGAADFGWRISMAPVVADGAFSLFPGIDRVLTVIEGRGLQLTLGDAPPVTLTGAPIAFPGDVPCQATLTAGPITDLNVMTRRGQWRAVVRHSTSLGTLPGAAHHLVFANATPLAGEVAGKGFALGLRDTLHLTPSESAALAPPGRWLDIQLLPQT